MEDLEGQSAGLIKVVRVSKTNEENRMQQSEFYSTCAPKKRQRPVETLQKTRLSACTKPLIIRIRLWSRKLVQSPRRHDVATVVQLGRLNDLTFPTTLGSRTDSTRGEPDSKTGPPSLKQIFNQTSALCSLPVFSVIHVRILQPWFDPKLHSQHLSPGLRNRSWSNRLSGMAL